MIIFQQAKIFDRRVLSRDCQYSIIYKQSRYNRMPKKFNATAKAKNAIADNLQIYQHMNFLHQAAILLSNLPKDDSPTADSLNTHQAPITHDPARKDKVHLQLRDDRTPQRDREKVEKGEQRRVRAKSRSRGYRGRDGRVEP